MKIDILWVDLGIVFLVAVPYLVFIWLNRKETVKLKKAFWSQAEKMKLKISLTDSWNGNFIGLDEQQAKILLVQKRSEGFVDQVLDLKNFRHCRLVHLHSDLKVEGQLREVLQKVDLELSSSLQAEPYLLNLFDAERDHNQEYEMQHARKWERLINENIPVRPHSRRVA